MSFRQAAMAVGLSAAALINPGPGFEQEPVPGHTTYETASGFAVPDPPFEVHEHGGVHDTPEVVDQFEVDNDTTYQVVYVEDETTQTSKHERLAELERATENARDLAALATGGQVQMTFLETQAVKLDKEASVELCGEYLAAVAESDDSRAGWYARKDQLQLEALQQAQAKYGPPAEVADTTIFYWDFETCPDGAAGEAAYDVGFFDLYRSGSGPDPDPIPPDIFLHEDGHERAGFGHSDLAECPRSTYNESFASIGGCEITEYAAKDNIMAFSFEPINNVYNEYQLARMGILRESQIAYITESGIYKVEALQNSTKGKKLFLIPASGEWMGDNNPETPLEQEYWTLELSNDAPDRNNLPCPMPDAMYLDPGCLGFPPGLAVKVSRAHGPHTTTIFSPTTTIDLNGLDSGLGMHSPNAAGTPFFSDEFGTKLTLISIAPDKGNDYQGTAFIKVELPKDRQN